MRPRLTVARGGGAEPGGAGNPGGRRLAPKARFKFSIASRVRIFSWSRAGRGRAGRGGETGRGRWGGDVVCSNKCSHPHPPPHPWWWCYWLLMVVSRRDTSLKYIMLIGGGCGRGTCCTISHMT